MPDLSDCQPAGIDASTLGNHDFDYGWRRTEEFIRIAHFPIVSANIVDTDGKTMTRPYVIQTVGGIRVGIIGAILGDLVGTVITRENAGPWHDTAGSGDSAQICERVARSHRSDRSPRRISTIRAK